VRIPQGRRTRTSSPAGQEAEEGGTPAGGGEGLWCSSFRVGRASRDREGEEAEEPATAREMGEGTARGGSGFIAV
jgi:hypothetical protein